MSRVRAFADGLMNVVANLGTARDKASHSHYGVPVLSDFEATNAYRGAWLPRKIVDIPALDACRNWRSWNAQADDISALEAEEERLGLRMKMQEGLKKARLYGGAALYIGTGDSDPSKPLNAERIAKGGIRHLSVMTRRVLKAGEVDRDPESPLYGRPAYYTLQGAGRRVEIHPSRLVVLTGAMHPDPETATGDEAGWGDSVLTAVMDAIKNADGTAANVASLVYEAKVDVIGIPNLTEMLSDPDAERQITERLRLAMAMKGINGALIRDAEETYDQKSYAFAGLTDILNTSLQIVSGAADIPVTRLLGQAPGGLNSSGESDLRNYYDRIRAMQELEIAPALYTLDECLIRSALGTRPEEVFYDWRSLWQTTDKERADIGKVVADTIKVIDDTGLLPDAVWSKTAANMLVEAGIAPGLEAALEEFGEPDDDPDDEQAALGVQTEPQQAEGVTNVPD